MPQIGMLHMHGGLIMRGRGLKRRLLLVAAMLIVLGAAPIAAQQTGAPPETTMDPRQLRRGAERGDVVAQRQLGYLYGLGEGVPRDDAQAVFWFRMAADRGDIESMKQLGMTYASDQNVGVRRDYAEAARWFLKAASRGDLQGQQRVAQMYMEGNGLPRDDVRAYAWFTLAIEASKRAKLELSIHYNTKDRELVGSRMTRSQIAEALKLTRGLVSR